MVQNLQRSDAGQKAIDKEEDDYYHKRLEEIKKSVSGLNNTKILDAMKNVYVIQAKSTNTVVILVFKKVNNYLFLTNLS